MELKANELRHGSIIDFDDGSTDRVKVEWLFKADDTDEQWFVQWTKLSGNGGFEKGNSILNDFKGIRLSPSILKKSDRITQDKMTGEWFFAKFNIRKEDEDSYAIYIHGGVRFWYVATVQYVHQLQNLHHSLTQTELNINL